MLEIWLILPTFPSKHSVLMKSRQSEETAGMVFLNSTRAVCTLSSVCPMNDSYNASCIMELNHKMKHFEHSSVESHTPTKTIQLTDVQIQAMLQITIVFFFKAVICLIIGS